MDARADEPSPNGATPAGSTRDEEADMARAKVRAQLFGGELPTLSVSRFQLLSRAGSGGMGVVFAAYDPQLDRRVAIKLLKATGTEDPERAQQRLLREAKVLARLSHANIVTVHDAGTHQGSVYLAMEWVDGQTLRAITRDRSLPWREVVAIFVAAGRGLAAAHAEGILHRDFKPDNVMRGEDGRVRVLDFGLAIPMTHGETASTPPWSSDEDVSVTKTGALVGTPRYLSPERLDGVAPDQSADQYAFCISLWDALTGRDPFPLSPLEDRRQAMEQEVIERPSGSSVPGWVLDVVARGLRARPEQRWPSMDALLDALERDPARGRRRWAIVLGGVVLLTGAYGVGSLRTEVCTGSEAALDDAWSETRRERVAAVMTGSALPYARAAWERIEPRLEGYAGDWVEQHQQSCEATAVRREQTAEVMERRMACLRRAREQLAAVAELLEDGEPKTMERATQLVDGLPEPSRCAEAEVLESTMEPPPAEHEDEVEAIRAELSRHVAELDAGRYAAARTALEQLDERTRALDYGPLRAEVSMRLGNALEREGHYEDAAKALEQALRLGLAWHNWPVAKRSAALLIYVVGARLSRYPEALAYAHTAWGLAGPEPRPDDEARLRFEVGQVKLQLGQLDEAEQEFRTALAVLNAQPEPEALTITIISNSLAGLLESRYDHDEAEALLRRSLAVQTEALGSEHPRVAQTMRQLANVLIGQQRYDEAEQLLTRSLEQFGTAAGTEHPIMAEIHNDMARVLNSQERHAEAEHHFRRAIELGTRTLGPNARMVNYARNNLGVALRDQRRFEEAEQLLRLVYDDRVERLPENHDYTLWTQTILGEVLGELGRTDEAAALLRDVAERWAKVEGERAFQVGFAHRVLGQALTTGERWDEAEAALELALSIHEDALSGDEPPDEADKSHVAVTHLGLARLLHARGQRDAEALEHAEAALSHYESAPPSTVRGASLAKARFLTAQISWTDPQQRPRARELVEAALQELPRDGQQVLRQQIEQWQDEHR